MSSITRFNRITKMLDSRIRFGGSASIIGAVIGGLSYVFVYTASCYTDEPTGDIEPAPLGASLVTGTTGDASIFTTATTTRLLPNMTGDERIAVVVYDDQSRGAAPNGAVDQT
jgi:hypothetical protein